MLKRQGFTLIELLVVMGIILVLTAIAIPAVNAARSKAKNMQVKAGCNTIQKALEEYAVDNTGFYPGAHYVTNGNAIYSGPGVIGGLPTYDGTTPRKDFLVAKQASDARGPNGEAPFLAPGITNPNVLDSLVERGYIKDYPTNPFLAAGGGVRAQMSNLFLFHPKLSTSGSGPAFPSDVDATTLDWNRYTGSGESMRVNYADVGRGHFSYIPLNARNDAGIDFAGQWGALSDLQRSQFYKGCRGYMLIGWGNSRADDSESKGLSEKFWRSDLNTTGGFDFDQDGKCDLLERLITAGGFIQPEVVDSSGSSGKFNAQSLGIPNIDTAFDGATFIKISGS
jgi:prepilin-type N-terminal cleavage/methylation domain-containing protein